MATQIQCPHCGQTYDLAPEQVPQYAGQTITCTRCQKSFTVAANLGGAPAAPAAPATPASPVSTVRHAQPTGSVTPPGMPPNYPQAQAQYSIPAGPQQSNGMAIASLICGLLGCTGIGGILAIIFGIVALNKTKDPRYGGRGMAIAGLVLGCFGLIVPCMVSILLPSLNRARETANRVHCASNMRQIGQAMLLYANENKGAFPPNLDVLLKVQDIDAKTFNCPSTGDTPATGPGNLNAGGHLSYVYVGQKSTSNSPAEVIVLFEPVTNHTDGANFLFADGHVEFYSKADAQKMISKLQAGQNPPDMRPGH
jgi:prepilin-type processing-associated H-X9-DG protein/predicted Zn finger-like uncharacterized protein